LDAAFGDVSRQDDGVPLEREKFRSSFIVSRKISRPEFEKSRKYGAKNPVCALHMNSAKVRA